MKKTLAILVAILLFGAVSVAFANFGIHGGYVADTDACAGCHRAHTATSMIGYDAAGGAEGRALLVGPPTTQLYVFCYVCHSGGAPGAATDVENGIFDSLSPGGSTESLLNGILNGGGFTEMNAEASTSYHEYNGSAWRAWGEGTTGPGNYIAMDCGSCHDPHGSSNYRILKDSVNGHSVGGYAGTFSSDPDPDPQPWVVSNELGYPLRGTTDPNLLTPQPTDGFRLHRQYPDYLPNYTTARYARARDYGSGTEAGYTDRGMGGWCTACHENYMAIESITDQSTENRKTSIVTAILAQDIAVAYTGTFDVDSTSGFNASGWIQIGEEVIEVAVVDGNTFSITNRAQSGTPADSHTTGELVRQTYDAWDGNGQIARHRHPINTPMSSFVGDRALTIDPFVFYNNYPGGGIEFVDIPLEHESWQPSGNATDGNGAITNQTYDMNDYIGCLTCHRAHGTNASMSGYAAAGMSYQDIGGFTNVAVPDLNALTPGVPPANGSGALSSQLLRADNRGVCERCHNK